MNETSKSYDVRCKKRHFDLYLKGHGIDIGGGNNVLKVQNGKVDRWDTEDGDAQLLSTVDSNKYDFVYSSHCLEHLRSVEEGLINWLRILKAGGYLFFTVPEYVLYEKMTFPSRFNTDHKNTFSAFITRKKTGRENHFFYNDIITLLKKHNA